MGRDWNMRIGKEWVGAALTCLIAVTVARAQTYTTSGTGSNTVTVLQNGNFNAGANTNLISGTNPKTIGIPVLSRLTIGDGIGSTNSTRLVGASGTWPGAHFTINSDGAWVAGSSIRRVASLSGVGSLGVANNNLFEFTGEADGYFSGTISGGGAGGSENGGNRTKKTGLSKQVLAGTNLSLNATFITAGVLQFGKRVSLFNAATNRWTGANLVTFSNATAAFNFGGPGEFTAADLDILKGLSGSSGQRGFQNGSILGIDTTGAGGNFTYDRVLANPNGDAHPVGLAKFGSGTLTLSGANTYSGITTVSAGTLKAANLTGSATGGGAVIVTGSGILAGSGSINGRVLIAVGGTLQPGLDGSDTATLTVNNALELAGTTRLTLNRTNAQASSRVTGISTLTCGGTLILTNAGPALVAGDTFVLFQAGSYLGGFAALVLPPLEAGLAWDTDALAANGTVSVRDERSATVLTLSASANPAIHLAPVTFTAEVTPGEPTGSVVFLTNGVALVTNSLVAGRAVSTPTTGLPVGNNLITAIYSGDNTHFSSTNSITLTVLEPNVAPVLHALTATTVDELTPLTVTATATDNNVPAQRLTFSLVDAPAGMSINPDNGQISWTPTEAHGPGVFTLAVRVTDNGTPNLSDTKSFMVSVRDANAAPVLTMPADQSLPSGVNLAVTCSATDADLPTDTLRFSLLSAPAGMTINAGSGALAWSPSLAQRPSTNTVTVRVTDNGSPALTDTGSFTVITLESPDTTRPTVAMVSPVAGTRTNHPIVTVRGTARDNRQIARVVYSLNNAPFAEATGTTNWSAEVVLKAGTNFFSVKSVDAAGNESLSLQRMFFHIVNSPLTITINGSGTATPDLNGAILEVGRSYFLTAVPGANWVFKGWSGGVSSGSTRVSFLMQTNLTVLANFETNKFMGAAGVYNGLFSEAEGARHESAGFFTLKLSSRQTFSGKISVDGGSYSMSGLMNYWSGQTRIIVPRKGKNALIVDLQLPFDGSDQMTGTIGNGDWSANLLGDLAMFNTWSNPPVNFVGRYTMLLPGSTNVAQSPPGSGYGVMTVASNGLVTLAGAASDGAPIKQTVALSKHGYWPLYVPLYSGPFVYTNGPFVLTNKQYYGLLIGWERFSPDNGRALGGSVVHLKSSLGSHAFYPQGFTNEVQLLGSGYNEPGTGCRALNLTDGAVVLQNGNLSTPVSAAVTLTTNNLVLTTSPNPLLVKLTVTPRTGLLKGTFANPGNANKVTTLTGAVLQNSNLGGGFFLGTNQCGALDLWGR